MSTQTITVRGAGIFGLSVAWALRARGARVRVVDPKGPGAGASGGVLGALAPHVPERWNAKKAFQLDSLILAEALWAEIAEVSGLDPGYGRIGRLQPIPDAAALALAQQRASTAEHLWQGRYRWRVIQAADAPIASPTGFYVHDDLSARLQPRRAIAALVEALRRRGVPVVAEAAADGPEVWATGAAGLSELSDAVGQPVGTAVKGQAALLAADLSGPQLFVDALHIVPHGNRQVAVGSTTERDAADPTRTDGTLDALIDRARALVPKLRPARVLDRWAALRPRARSRAPMLGPHPTRPGIFIANGGFKIGFGMAPKVGEVMADLILDGRDTVPPGFRVADNLRG